MIRDTLTAGGVGVEELVVYEADRMPDLGGKLQRALEGAGEGHMSQDELFKPWVLLFSPAGCDGVVEALGLDKEGAEGRGRVRIATIGPTTRDHLRERFAVEVDVCAERPSPEGVAGEIVQFLLAQVEKEYRKDALGLAS